MCENCTRRDFLGATALGGLLVAANQVRGEAEAAAAPRASLPSKVRICTIFAGRPVPAGRSWGVSMAYRQKKLAQYLRGWMNYFGIAEYDRPIPERDHWLRRRVRMGDWKQWRTCRTNVRNLLKLGVPLKAAM